MNWIEVNESKELPKSKVLAICGMHEESMILGKLHKLNGTVACIDNDSEISLSGITHYVELNSLFEPTDRNEMD